MCLWFAYPWFPGHTQISATAKSQTKQIKRIRSHLPSSCVKTSSGHFSWTYMLFIFLVPILYSYKTYHIFQCWVIPKSCLHADFPSQVVQTEECRTWAISNQCVHKSGPRLQKQCLFYHLLSLFHIKVENSLTFLSQMET